MTAREPLLDIIAAWRRLTLTETEALQARDWSTVAQCQSRKEELRHAFPFQPHAADGASAVQSGIAELISLESANLRRVKESKAALELQRQLLETASRRLRSVRNSYSSECRCSWQCYS